jgi:transcriptional regulator with XRE-family HTH domain
MTLQEAILELRRVSGKSQQVLATELGMATKTLQLYEQGRLPEPRKLLALAAYADRMDREDLYVIFLGDALMDQLIPPPGYEVEITFKPSPPSPRRKK